VLLRLKEEYDGAEPAASSVAVLNLLVLAHLTGDAGMSERITRTLSGFESRVAGTGRAVPMLLAAVSTYHAGIPQIVIVGDGDEAGFGALRQALGGRYLPTAVSVPVREARRPGIERLLPWVAAMSARGGSAAAYVCRDFACQVPVTSAEALMRQLDEDGVGPP
jgi:uncharacterized protein YyaL (SSP411 family)